MASSHMHRQTNHQEASRAVPGVRLLEPFPYLGKARGRY